MYMAEYAMQLIEIVVALACGIYFFTFIYIFYRKEKEKIRERDVRRYTLEYCIKKINLLNKYTDDKTGVYENNEDAIYDILNLFECLSVGVYTGVFDEEVVARFFGSYMRNFYENDRINLFEMRKRKNNAGVYANYEQFMEEWDFRQERLKCLNARRGK